MQITKNIETEQDPIPLVRTLLELFSNVDSEALRSDLLKAVCGMMRMYRSRSRHRKRRQLPGWDAPWAAGQITLQAVMPLMQSVSDSDVLKSIVIDVRILSAIERFGEWCCR